MWWHIALVLFVGVVLSLAATLFQMWLSGHLRVNEQKKLRLIIIEASVLNGYSVAEVNELLLCLDMTPLTSHA